MLRTLATDTASGVSHAVAANPSTPVDLLYQLASTTDQRVPNAVARNPSTPEKLLRQLAKDTFIFVRQGVAENPLTPKDLLCQLATDAFADVRHAAAANPTTPVDRLHQLATDGAPWVRYGVAKNPSSPLDVVLHCLPCVGVDSDARVDAIQTAFAVHQDKLLPIARAGEMDFDMVCAGGETLKEGLINGGQAEIYNLLMAEYLAGKAERMANNVPSLQPVCSRRI